MTNKTVLLGDKSAICGDTRGRGGEERREERRGRAVLEREGAVGAKRARDALCTRDTVRLERRAFRT